MPSIAYIRSEVRAAAESRDIDRLAKAVEMLCSEIDSIERKANEAYEEARSAKREAKR